MNETKDAYKLDESQEDLKKLAEAFSKVMEYIERMKEAINRMEKTRDKLERMSDIMLDIMSELSWRVEDLSYFLVNAFDLLEKYGEERGVGVEQILAWWNRRDLTGIRGFRMIRILRAMKEMEKEYENGEIPKDELIRRVAEGLGVKEKTIEKDLEDLQMMGKVTIPRRGYRKRIVTESIEKIFERNEVDFRDLEAKELEELFGSMEEIPRLMHEPQEMCGPFQSGRYRRSEIMRILAEMEKEHENGEVPREELIVRAAKELNMTGKEGIIEKDIRSLYESGKIYIPRPGYVKIIPRGE